MNYKTYAEAKIANPDCEIVTTGKDWAFEKSLKGVFQALGDSDGLRHSIGDDAWVICNPADYCSSLKEFFDDGFKLVAGDKIIGTDKGVWDIAEYTEFNEPDEEDCERYILSVSALNGGCKISKTEAWTIYSNTMPLSELSDEQAAQLFNAWRKNISISELDAEEWVNVSPKQLSINGVYRIKQKTERELFIHASVQLMTSQELNMAHMFGVQFDAGARYTDLTQYFGENI